MTMPHLTISSYVEPTCTELNPLYVKSTERRIIYPSVRPSIRLPDFCDFCMCINHQGGGQALHLSPHWDLKDPSGVQLSLYVHLSVFLFVHPY